MIIGIVAISNNYAIGREGNLPWHYSADLKFFRETTSGNAVVMGGNTWRSIGKPLPNRVNIVLSRSGKVEIPSGVILLREKGGVRIFAKEYDRDVFVIGGAKTYSEVADEIDKWIVTFVPVEIEDADTYMPLDFLDGFAEIENRELEDGLIVKILHRKRIIGV